LPAPRIGTSHRVVAEQLDDLRVALAQLVELLFGDPFGFVDADRPPGLSRVLASVFSEGEAQELELVGGCSLSRGVWPALL